MNKTGLFKQNTRILTITKTFTIRMFLKGLSRDEKYTTLYGASQLMTKRLALGVCLIGFLVCYLGGCFGTVDRRGTVWEPQLLIQDGRIDAITAVDNNVIIIGTRAPHPGYIFVSKDYGLTWFELGQVVGDDDIKCLGSGKNGLACLITGKGYFWRSADVGDSWKNLGKISQYGDDQGARWPYGLIVLESGTILVSDTNPQGGHIFRSTNNGESWTDLGPISHRELYRFQNVGNGVLVNGWAGHIYKSLDDGQTWSDGGQLIDSPLYATEYLGKGVVLQGSENGHIFRSKDHGQTWVDLGGISEATDDIVNLGQGISCLNHVYRGQEYVSHSGLRLNLEKHRTCSDGGTGGLVRPCHIYPKGAETNWYRWNQ